MSGGNQQKVVIAKWLATEPRLLIIDEPTRGIDVGTKAEVHRLLSELAGQGMAILMISSELPEVLGMADRVLVVCEGHLTADIARDDATPRTSCGPRPAPGRCAHDRDPVHRGAGHRPPRPWTPPPPASSRPAPSPAGPAPSRRS